MNAHNRKIVALYAKGTPLDTLMHDFGLDRQALENIIDDEPLSPAQKATIRAQHDGGRGKGIYTLARLYGVSRDCIDNIVSCVEYQPVTAG